MVIGVIMLVLAAVLSLSNGIMSDVTIGGRTLFDFVDRLNSIYLPPICALCAVIFLGWVMDKRAIKEELSNRGTLKTGYFGVFMFLVRFVAPAALVTVLVTGIVNG